MLLQRFIGANYRSFSHRRINCQMRKFIQGTSPAEDEEDPLEILSSARSLAVAHAVADCLHGPRVASSLVFRLSRSCEFAYLLLRTADLALDKIRLKVCRFLQAGGQGELSRVFKVGPQALL